MSLSPSPPLSPTQETTTRQSKMSSAASSNAKGTDPVRESCDDFCEAFSNPTPGCCGIGFGIFFAVWLFLTLFLRYGGPGQAQVAKERVKASSASAPFSGNGPMMASTKALKYEHVLDPPKAAEPKAVTQTEEEKTAQSSKSKKGICQRFIRKI